MRYFTPKDFAIYKNKQGNIESVGVPVDSFCAKNNLPIQSGGGRLFQSGGNLQNLAVPAGLYVLRSYFATKTYVNEEYSVLSEDIYDKLLKYVKKPGKKKKKTRKLKRKRRKNKTRRFFYKI